MALRLMRGARRGSMSQEGRCRSGAGPVVVVEQPVELGGWLTG